MMGQMSIEEIRSLPEPTGPYQVGIVKYDLHDEYRKEIDYPEGRLIPIQIYFPIRKGKHSKHPKQFEERTPGKWVPLDVEVWSQKAELSLLMEDMQHSVILLNHGDTVAMTDYAFIAEDLASQGYVVITIQHQLKTDPEEPKFWRERSVSRYGKVIDNILYVFRWLQDHEGIIFNHRVDLKHIGLIGHSMGGNALLLLASRAFNRLKEITSHPLLPHHDPEGVKEAIIVLDIGGFPYPHHNQYPLFLLMSEEREDYQRRSGAYEEMINNGHKVNYYPGSKHISFMDHGYIDPPHPFNSNEHYFNGTLEEKKAFFNQVRSDIREFLKENNI